MAQVSYGTITITDTNDIESITIQYARNQSTSTAPTSGWGTDRPAWAQGYYIWQRTCIHKSGTDESSDTYGTAVCITGSTGQTGDTGRSLVGTVTKYTHVANGTTQSQVEALAENNWNTNVPTYSSSLPDYWVRITNTYDTAPLTENIYYKDNGITDAIAKASAAEINSLNALNQATAATQATALLGGHFIYNSEWTTTNTPHSANVVQTILKNGIDVTQDPTQWDYNVHIGANGIRLRNNENVLSEWTANALTFNNPSTGNAQLVIGANGTLQSGNYQRGSDTKFSTNGTKIDLINGDIITKYFRLSQGLENLNAGAYIHGTIEALDGKIGAGSSNYWEIGQYTDYNNTTNATMVGHGGSFIQLGDSSTWRLATNRIHTGWYATGDTVLHYPQDGNNKYWDFGIHVPYSDSPSGRGNDKFIYIRTQNAANNSLQNLLYDLDDNYSTQQWEYKFWIDKDGKVHAQNFYVGNSTTPIGGGAGTIAEKLLTGAGSLTQPVYFRSDEGHVGEVATTTYQLNAAGAKGVDTSMPATATNDNVPTTLLMKNFVEGKGYITSYTDEKVKVENKNTTKLWVTGTATAGTTTGTLAYDTNIYIDTTAGALHATTFNGYTLAAASAKGVDTSLTTSTTSTNLPTSAAVVNLIKQYLPLTGGNVTGAVTFGDSVSVDELTVGDLVVNGSASFTNNLQANTINGIAVGNNPKFTDTVTTVTVTGSGNAITSMTASNGAITATKGSTFLTSYTETDPIFVASAAHDITSNDISNWNSKTSNTGTVTSVRVQASSPLQSSVSTAQNESLNTTISFINQDANTILAGPASGSTAAAPTFRTLVAADIPDISGTYYLASNPNNYTSNLGTITNVVAGTGLSGGGSSGSVTLNHSNSVIAQTTQAVYPIKIDAQGHISAYGSSPTTLSGYGITDAKIVSGVITLGSNTITPLTSQWTANLITGASATVKANEAASNNVYLNLVENNTVRNSHQITGSGTVSVASDANGKITITGTAHPSTLPNPKSLKLKVYSGTSTSSDTTYYGGENANTEVNVAGITAITGISASAASGGSTTFTLTKANGDTSTFDVTVTASIATGATTLTDANGDPITAGGATTAPVWFNSGVPEVVTSIPSSLISGTVSPSSHSHGNITNGGDITATAPTIANGDQLIINDHSASKITNGPTFDGSTTTEYLTKAGTWGTPVGTTYTAGTGLDLTGGEFSVKLGYTTSGNNRKVQADSDGNLYVIQKDDNTNYYHTTGSWSGLTYTATANGGAGALAFTIPTGTSSSTVLRGDHTYATSIATSTGTNQLTLEYGRKYSLTAGGTSYIFTMPASDDTDTHRPIQLKGTEILGNNTTALNFAEGNNITLSNSGGTITINSSYTNTDEKVKLSAVSTQTGTYPLMLAPTGTLTSGNTYQGYYHTGITVTPNTGTVTATTFVGALTGTASGNLTSVQYDSTNSKFTYTKNGSNTDIVTITNLQSYLGLGAAAYKGITDNSSATAVTSTDTNLITARTLYYAGYVKSSGVTSITLTQGTGISISNSGTAITSTGSRTISLATITKSDTTSTASPAHGGTFTAIDSITYDTYGRVTGINTKTITLPSDVDTKVTQTKWTSGSTIYDVLLSGSVSDAATATTTSYKTARLKFDPTNSLLTTGTYSMSGHAAMTYNSELDAIVFSFA